MTSIVVEAFDDVVKFFDGAKSAAPPGDTTIPQAQAAVTSAKTAVQAAIPALAEGAANAALGLIPLGSLFAPEVDQIIALVIQKLEAKFSSAGAASVSTSPASTAGSEAAAGAVGASA